VWQRGVLSEARVAKKARDEEALEAAHGGKEGLDAHRAVLAAEAARVAAAAAAKRDEAAALHRMTGLAKQAAALAPGCRAPPALPAQMNKKEASAAPFSLSEKELKAIPSARPGRELVFQLVDVLRVAQRKAGGEAGFARARQQAVDSAASPERNATLALIEHEAAAWPALLPAARAAAAAQLAAEAAVAEEEAAHRQRIAIAKRAAATAAAATAATAVEGDENAGPMRVVESAPKRAKYAPIKDDDDDDYEP
jgi:hypothetical protein